VGLSSSEARLVLSAYFARLGFSLSGAWLSALGGPASVAGATALSASTLICLWLTFVDLGHRGRLGSFWVSGLFDPSIFIGTDGDFNGDCASSIG